MILIALRRACAKLHFHSLHLYKFFKRKKCSQKLPYTLCVDETKLDASFPDNQLKIPSYQFLPLRTVQNSKGGGKIRVLL